MTMPLWDIRAGQWGGGRLDRLQVAPPRRVTKGEACVEEEPGGGGCVARCAREEEEGRLNGDGFHGGGSARGEREGS
jgi:hypothetical protein